MRRRGRLIGRHLAIPLLGAIVTAALVLDNAWSQPPSRRTPIRVAQAPIYSPGFEPSQAVSEEGAESTQAAASARFLPTPAAASAPPSEEIEPPDHEEVQDYTVPLRGPSDGMILEAEDGLVSLVARNASLQDVLTALAETQGLNLITQESVTAQLNTTLHRLPFEDVLDVILSTSGYTWVRNRNVIQVTSVANSQGLAPETQGRMVEVFQLDYVSATDVSSVVQTMLSPAGSANVIESAADDNRRTQEVLVVQDLPGYIENIRNYIRRHDVPPRQVLIEAYILKVELTDDMRHGVDFEELFNVSSNMVQLGTTGFANAAASTGFLVNLSGGNLGAVVEMLENSADAKTLASPKIRVLNGQTARIQAGEQLGFRVTTTTQTSTTESVQFLDVGVVLEVTPRIGADGTVIMRVSPEVSSGQINPATGLPEEKTTELQTDVMFKDNQAYVVGGLIQEVDTDTQTKLPYLGNLKYLGFFFKRAEVVKRRSEIIIALLPRVMPFDPIADEQLRMETESAMTPLLYGPLLKNPRPWEPQLPGAYNNPHMLRLPPTWDYFSLQDSYDCEVTAVAPARRATSVGTVDGEVRIVRTPPLHMPTKPDGFGVNATSRMTRLPSTIESRPVGGEVPPANRGTMLR